MLRAMKKKIKKNYDSRLLFDADMYNNTYGSLIICGYLFTEFENDKERLQKAQEIKKTWYKAVKGKIEVNTSIAEKDFIDKTLEIFGLKRPDVFPIAMCQSQFNVIFAPYVDGKILPLREDRIYNNTMLYGKIYPIDFNEKAEENDNKSE